MLYVQFYCWSPFSPSTDAAECESGVAGIFTASKMTSSLYWSLSLTQSSAEAGGTQHVSHFILMDMLEIFEVVLIVHQVHDQLWKELQHLRSLHRWVCLQLVRSYLHFYLYLHFLTTSLGLRLRVKTHAHAVSHVQKCGRWFADPAVIEPGSLRGGKPFKIHTCGRETDDLCACLPACSPQEPPQQGICCLAHSLHTVSWERGRFNAFWLCGKRLKPHVPWLAGLKIVCMLHLKTWTHYLNCNLSL